MPAEALMDLRRRLATLPPRSPERRRLMHETARLYGVSEQTLYRILHQQGTPHAVTRRLAREVPAWVDATKGPPTLMLYSVVDDRSGVAYQEYHCAYGEDVETALKFLFSAMAPKADARFPFCGRPHALYV